MSLLKSNSTVRTNRRASATVVGSYAATHAQAARFLAFEGGASEVPAVRAPLWDDTLLDRLTQPLSRIRE